jgi:ribosomal protein L3 glutamine methyltransferase
MAIAPNDSNTSTGRRFMPRLSHSTAARQRASQAAPLTLAAVLGRSARRLARAGLHFGHGTDNARDEAAALIWHVLRLPNPVRPAAYARPVSQRERSQIDALLDRRIRERIPAVYLTRRCWFAGLSMYVDQRVLIPRSPIAELIEHRFAPWIESRRVRRILDLGTGSGCIAIACARAFPAARVDALDISSDALAVARRNVRRHRLQARVRTLQSDHFAALKGAGYDIIVSNPPYVGRRELRGLPAEYRHEPRLALAAGADGLDSVRTIVDGAAAHLRPSGILIVEVGNSEAAVRRAFPRLPFVWLSFERGGGGVFALRREQLAHALPARNIKVPRV